MPKKIRNRRVRGPPCESCGFAGCRSSRTFACFMRSWRRALDEHGFGRAISHTGDIRRSGLPILFAPISKTYDVTYGPKWAVAYSASLCAQKVKPAERYERIRAAAAKRPEPLVPPELLERIDMLKAFAILSGWKYERGTWETS